jgi:hypothetical protein
VGCRSARDCIFFRSFIRTISDRRRLAKQRRASVCGAEHLRPHRNERHQHQGGFRFAVPDEIENIDSLAQHFAADLFEKDLVQNWTRRVPLSDCAS